MKTSALACVFGYTTLSVFATVVSQAEVESRDGVAAGRPELWKTVWTTREI
jgi:hypothetical protein